MVSRKVVIRDEKPVDALRPVEAHKALHIVCRTIARFTALHVDDRAEGALVRAPTACVKTRTDPDRTADMALRKEGHRRSLHRRQVLREVVKGRKLTCGSVGQQDV